MTDFAADDYPGIAQRMREIKGENPPTTCAKCEDTGWSVKYQAGSYPTYEVCPICGNPMGKPKP